MSCNTWLRAFQSMKAKRNNYYISKSGNSCSAQGEILKHLHKHGFEEVETVDDCNVILVFCPIVSRAGTDMEAALDELNTHSESKPAVFMVLHHTFDKEKILPDSSRYINRRNTLTLNFLFNEDDGLLKCDRNANALAKMDEHFIPQKRSLVQLYYVAMNLWRFCSQPKVFGGVLLVAIGAVIYCRRKHRF